MSFETEIVATSCPADPEEWKQSFKIYSVGIDESLTVDLELLCSCSCEDNGKTNAAECKNHGTLLCGNCNCEQYYYGRSCECSKDNPDKHQHQCRSGNITKTDCSGRGSCVCGQCVCADRDNPEEIISGEFCQCDNYSCERENGLLCSGPDQDKCDCGACICEEGWSGPACQCTTSEETCKAPNALNGELCSGQGSCVCGRCECEINVGIRYSGKYCDKCPTCLGRCDELKDCVECQMYKKGNYSDPNLCSENCKKFKTIGVEALNCKWNFMILN